MRAPAGTVPGFIVDCGRFIQILYNTTWTHTERIPLPHTRTWIPFHLTVYIWIFSAPSRLSRSVPHLALPCLTGGVPSKVG
jgi:hypothetical protein